MSQASGGEELWQCAACTTSVPLSIGKNFKVCPFCEAGLTTPTKSVTACLPLQTGTDAELETSTLILSPRPACESKNFTLLAGTEHLTHPPSAEGIIAVNQSDVGATYTDTSNEHIINEYTTENTEKTPNLPGEEVAQGPSNENLAQRPSNDPPREHLTRDHTNNLSPLGLGLVEGDAQEAGTVEVGSSDQNETSPEFLHVGIATPEADAEQLTSTLNQGTSSPKLGESENSSHLPALAGAEYLTHPPSAEGIIAVNQSDVGTTGTGTGTDTETSKENRESTMENTQSPPRENLTRAPSNDPPSPGEEGATQLKAGTEETGISDQIVNSPEFPVTTTAEIDAELVTSTSNLDIPTPRPDPDSETPDNFTHVAGAEHLIHPPSAEEIIAGNQSYVGATGTDTETTKENKSTTEDTQSRPREKLTRNHSKDPPSPPGAKLTRGLSNDPPSPPGEKLTRVLSDDPPSPPEEKLTRVPSNDPPSPPGENLTRGLSDDSPSPPGEKLTRGSSKDPPSPPGEKLTRDPSKDPPSPPGEKLTRGPSKDPPSLLGEQLTRVPSNDPPSPQGENLTRGLSDDPPSVGEEGAEQLKAGVSDQNVNSPEFPVVVIDTTGSIPINCTSAPTPATCEYCDVNIPDPSVRYCEGCLHSTKRKDTEFKTQLGPPPCYFCGKNLNDDPAAHICPFCGTPDRDRQRLKRKADTDSSQRQLIFGPSNFNPSLHGGAHLQFTAAEPSNDQVRNNATVREPMQSVQRKRTSSESSSLGQMVKHPKVDSSSCMVVPKNGQKVDHSPELAKDEPPPDLAPTKDSDAHEHADVNKNSWKDGAEKTTKDSTSWYMKPKQAEGLLHAQSHKSNKGKLPKNPPKSESRHCQHEMADPRKICGLTDSRQPFEIVFHVIIPKPHWEWDKTSKVFLRFGCEELGSWNLNVGLFQERDINEIFSELTCRLSIQHGLLKQCIPYKYVVFTPKTLNKPLDWSFEFLHDIHQHDGKFLNRFLRLSQEDFKKASNRGTYHQYDSMAFPEHMRVSTGIVETLFTGANKLFTGANKLVLSMLGLKSGESGKKKETLKVLPNSDMRYQCLLLYLEKYKHLFSLEFSQEMSIDKVVEDVQHIFSSFSKIKVTYRVNRNDYNGTISSIDRELRPLRKCFLGWLQPTVEQLQILTPEKQLALSTCLAWCIIKLEIPPKLIDFAPLILKHLCAKHPGTEPQQWVEFSYLCHFTPKACRPQLAIALQCFIVQTIDKGSGIERLYPMPLCNFLSGSSQPYDDLFSKDCEMMFKNWSQLSQNFTLADVRMAAAKNSSFVELFFSQLDEMFELDPMVLLAFVYICPETNLCALFEKILPHVSTAWLLNVIGDRIQQGVSRENESELVSWIFTINTKLTSDVFRRYSLNMFVMINSALFFFERCTLILLAPSEHYMDIINVCLSLVFKSMALYIEVNGEKSFSDLHNVLASVQDSLVKWINHEHVIGGPMFGNGLSLGGQKDYILLPKRAPEIKIWRSLLTVECSSALMTEKWHEIVRDTLSKRIDQVPGHTTIQLLPFVEENGEEHQVLTDVIMNAAIKAVEKILLRPRRSATESFQQITTNHSRPLGKVLGTLLTKKYHQLTTEGVVNDWITLDVLLEWDLWPNYVKIVQQVDSPLHAGLQPKCEIACFCAVIKLKELCTQLQQGSISLYDLQKMKTKEVRLRRLCEALTFQDKKASLDSVFACIDMRLDEFEKFLLRKQAYMDICKWMPESITGIAELKKELEQDFDCRKIKDLCQVEGKTLKLFCFEEAKPLDSFVDHFGIMYRRSSILFVQPLNQKMKQVLINPGVTINEIYALVWQPVFEECQKLLDDLATHQITLATVDHRLKPHASTLKPDITNLAVGMHKCLNTPTAPNHSTLRSAMSKIEDYWRICEYRDGAQVFLHLKEVLQLSGDFALIQMFDSSLMSFKKDVTLASIDCKLIATGYFLKEILDIKSRMECLKAFVESQDIIEWLRKSTKSVKDIQGFVTVALATAAGGEDDLASDKLSHLRNVGNGFASLIYDILPLDGYVELMERCTSLWDSLTKIPNLPKLLVDCNKDVQWYQSVKETQGSVETTSYGQMSNILKYGTYRVGFKKNAQTVHDLITITLSVRCQNVVKRKYSLDELRDLESKLVLICGSKAENKAEVYHYLNVLHSATRIAELYLDLQRAGEVTYSDVSLTFRCAVYNAEHPGDKDVQFNEAGAKEEVATLHNYIKTLDEKLVAWKQSVDSARGKYYELNYFTTLQLLQLRKELGTLTQTNITHTVKPNVLMLLKSISPQVTSGVVIKSLQATKQPEPMISEDNVEAATAIAATESEVMESTSSSCEKQNSQQSLSLASTMPSFTCEDLTEHQYKVYTYCVNSLGFSEGHVLRAFDECGKEATIYDMERWCDNNEDSLSSDEECSVGTLEIEEMMYPYAPQEDDSDSDDRLGVVSVSQASTATAAQLEGPVLDCSLQIRTVVIPTVDESHPGVLELVEAGYDTQDCVEAVQQCMGDVQEAMKLLDAREMEEGAQPGMFVRSISREEPMQHQGAVEADGEQFVEYRGSDSSSSHLQLDQLGFLLKNVSTIVPGAVDEKRSFDKRLLKAGLPNLLVTAPDNVLRSVLALYTGNHALPLPTQEEVLLCTSKTTTEEVSLLWRRAIGDPEYKRVFCLAHAERLSYQVCDAALRSLQELSQGKTHYHLVVICSKEDEDKSHIISRLHNYRRPVVPTLVVDNCKDYLKTHFVHHMNMELDDQATPTLSRRASIVDPENSCVRVVSSTRSGMGKSLYVKKKAASLKPAMCGDDNCVTIPIHGPVVTADTLMDYFKKYTGRDNCTIYHLDIAPQVLAEVDCILFSLLILRGLSDSRGLVWRSHASHLYMVEVTLPEGTSAQSDQEGFQTLNLLNLLPTICCSSPRVVALEIQQQLGADVIGMDDEEFKGPTIQRVYQYLRRHASEHNLDTFSYQDGTFEGDERHCLKIILGKCGIRDPSWAEIHHFTKFLDIQLNSCENSVFCDETLVGDVMSGLKGFVVKFMIRMSQDFSTPSLEGVLARDNLEEDIPSVPAAEDDNDQLEQYQIVIRRQWEHNSHPYIFFNEDQVSITFIGFMVTQNGDLVDPVHKTVLESAIMKPQLYEGLKQNKVNFDEDYRGWKKDQMITKIATVMGFDCLDDPDDTYVLTTDNLIKMLAIQMRFRCDIPVVIMGETGCGKTRLIRYMCNLARGGRDLKNMLILKIHGGVTDLDVTNFVEYAEETAQTNKAVDPRLSTVVFFDEANTTESIGLIKEVMCDRRVNGRPVSKDINFIAACNPYRKHSEDMIRKLETAGLGFYVRETQQKLGKIPLRQLVYRVLELPPSMCPLVYDFGQLNTATEYDYTRQIVMDHIRGHPLLCNESSDVIIAISTVLAASQKFMRNQKNECSFVSLRDVERAMIVFEYFYEKMESVFAPLIANRASRAEEDYNEFCAPLSDSEEEYETTATNRAEEDYNEFCAPLSDSEEEYETTATNRAEEDYNEFCAPLSDSEKEYETTALPPRHQLLSNVTSALILSVSVCYHARLHDRSCYEKYIATCFKQPLLLSGGAQQFRDEIRWCEEGLLDEMMLGSNIAKNAALRENVFMMAICIELRIPLFLVGKPGSSKSLAKSIIQDSMQGPGSRSPVLREFKQVHMFSYQCSQLSTPESVIEVFKSAERFQANQDTKQYVSVVVLDEVGLAEDSPSLPLKALHPLLEDGTEWSGNDHQQQTVEREKRVAFIGISNWALDPAKMNRGVMVTRGDPGKNDLKLSAEGICSNKANDPIREQLRRYFEPLSNAYVKVCNICEKQKRQFFGLRDFYSLIKMLYWMCERSMCQPLSWPQMEHAIRRNFGGLESEEINPLEEFRNAIGYIEDSQDFTGPNDEMMSIRNPDCSRLGLIKTSLNTKDTTWHGENRYLLFLTENYAALDILKHYLGVEGVNNSDLTSQPYILFGSSFPKDKEYTQVCRNINQIKICMETGRTVILLNLENLYESLYDVLNQYYMDYSGVRYVDLGLQTHRVKCRVHDNFKLILIAEKDTVYKKFPTPLINRLEKHFVLTSSVLEDWQSNILTVFDKWIQDFSKTSDFRGNHFSEAHAFIGYQKDTPAAVVFQATNLLKGLQQKQSLVSKSEQLQRAGIIGEDFADLSENSPQWSDSVLKLSQFLLLQTAADDAIIRLRKSTLLQEEIECLTSWYFKHQYHTSIGEFLQYECSNNRQMFMQVTTHCPLMTHEELTIVTDAVGMNFAHFDLHEFDSELDFSNKIGPKFLHNDPTPFLLIVQCDSGHLNSDLIACARYRVCDEAIRANAKNNPNHDITHILFVIRLPQQEIKSQFVGFQGDPWISVHIDDLRSTSEVTVIPEQALNASISELFIGRLKEKNEGNDEQELQQDSSSQFGIETGRKDSEDEMSDSAEHSQRMSDSDIDSDQDMSGDGEGIPHLPRISEVNRTVLSVDEASNMMKVEDAQLHDPSLIDVDFPPSELMLADKLPNDTMQIRLSPSDLTMDIESILPTSPTQYSDHNIFESSLCPVTAHPVVEVPTLDSFEVEEVPCQEDKLMAEQVRQGKGSGSFHPQHHRLLGCVQAAVSMLKDSQRDRAMHRIQKLMALIPKIHSEELGEAPFYDILIQFIYSALLQRERERVDEREWVLHEAMSGRKLQNGGTFRNVLARRIDEVITPYFAETIAHADQNCNLDLLDPKDLGSPVSRLWLNIFKFTGGRIDFSSLAEGKTTIRTDFHCRFPFSWFVMDMVDAQRAGMLGTEQRLHFSLCEALSLTDMGTILGSVEEDHVDKLYQLYLHDFVRYVHKSSHKSELSGMEYTLIMDALDTMTYRNDLCSVDGHESLSRKIVALHLLHGQCSSKVLQFGQLVQYRPGILRSLSRKDPTERTGEDFTLHLYAVQRVLELDQEDDDPTNQYLAGLNPPLHKPNQGNVTRDLQRWLNHVRMSQNVIDTILRSSSGIDAAFKSRLRWYRIRALQIFAEKVYLPHCKIDGILFIMRRLEIKLKNHSDFLKKVTLDEVKQLLNNMMFNKKLKAYKLKIKKSCNRFFIEVVSSLCFGGVDAPEPELVKSLLDTVLQDNQTSKLSPYKEQDKTPTIRSFLLQLLLEHEPDQVKLYLDEYFQRSIEVIKGRGMDQGLYLLCIQCLENSLHKRVSVLSADCRAIEIRRILEESYLALQNHLRTPTVRLQYLEAVAGVRYSLYVLAQKLKSDHHVNSSLLIVARDLCMDTRVNVIDPTGRVDTTGPVLYLMRLLVRQFGFTCLQRVSQAHPWVVPESLRRVDNEDKSIDLSVLYELGYKDVRNAVNSALFTNETTELTVCMQSGVEVCLLAFAFYQKATLSRASTAPADQIREEALQTLNTFAQSYPNLSPEMLQVLCLLLANQQGGTLAQMFVSPHQAHASLHRSITGLVVHTVAVLLSRAKTELLLPFLNMLTNPSVLENAYLPTMSEDILQEVRQAGGTFYECPNGHPYLVGECGNPMEQTTCRESGCGASIGGENERLRSDNKAARLNDTTKTGYDLGAPQQRTVNSERERTLSATAVSIVRALMHASFLWAACHDQQMELIQQVVKDVMVVPHGLAEFFWLHLEKDLESMQNSTGRGLDECVMIMHLVLKEILVTNPPVSGVSANMNQLHNKKARNEWEQQLNISYIEPVINQLEVFVAKALNLVANDDQQEQDRLFHLAYEKVNVDEGKLEAHLWSYRPQINLEHIKSTVQAGNECKILDTFLQIEPSLRATQYIPDIVRLQQFMFETFDRRLDKSKAETITIRDFLKEVKDTRNENIKNECKEMIENLKKAWALVGQKLKNHNRLPVEEKYLLAEINDKTPLVYLIPTTMREGRCTTALVDYLVLTHNDFIEKCRGIVSQGAESSSAVWREHKVPITHVHRCHLLEYEQHLHSIILSHCHYSLTMGSDQIIKYDLPALEKHVLNRFIYGKPVVLLDIPCVAYRKDIYTAETFQEIRRKVKPQIPLCQRVQRDIVTELRTPDKMKESLDVVDVVLGLLSSGGANHKISLHKYILSRTMGKKPFSTKAKEHCTLGHVLSLWETISVELAKQLWHTGLEPFEGIPKGYSADLSTDQFEELNQCLRTFDLALLLGTLFEFIEVHVKHMTANEDNFPLVESLVLYWDRTEQSPIIRLDKFPESITVPQAVATWKHVTEYKEKKH